MSIKIQYKNETKKIKKPSNYESLLIATKKAFGEGELPANFKYFYIDLEGDLISLSNEEDLLEAYECMNNSLKLTIEETCDSAKFALSESMKFSSQLPLQMPEGNIPPTIHNQAQFA